MSWDAGVAASHCEPDRKADCAVYAVTADGILF